MSECPLTSILPKHPEKNHIKRKTGNICESQIQVVCRRNSSCLWVFRRFSSEILFFLLSSTTTSLLIPTQMQNYPSRIPGLPCGQLDLPSASRMSGFRAGPASDAMHLRPHTAGLQVHRVGPSNRKPDLVGSGFCLCLILNLNTNNKNEAIKILWA